MNDIKTHYFLERKQLVRSDLFWCIFWLDKELKKNINFLSIYKGYRYIHYFFIRVHYKICGWFTMSAYIEILIHQYLFKLLFKPLKWYVRGFKNASSHSMPNINKRFQKDTFILHTLCLYLYTIKSLGTKWTFFSLSLKNFFLSCSKYREWCILILVQHNKIKRKKKR